MLFSPVTDHPLIPMQKFITLQVRDKKNSFDKIEVFE